MEDTEAERGEQTARQDLGMTPGMEPGQKPRRSDRRDGISLFGGYTGPERRSGRDRRAPN